MIVYPTKWNNIGQSIKIKEIENTVFEILEKINCNCLSFSGGIDSSFLLWCLDKIWDEVKAFTIGFSNTHPDIYFSKMMIKHCNNVKHFIIIPKNNIIKKEEKKGDFEGDNGVRLFYKEVKKYTNTIIAGDGIDEFMCGYYEHQKNQNEECYYSYMRKLQQEQLIPLNINSEKINVYLPYLDERLIFLLSQIPINEKVDNLNRKKIMIKLCSDKIPVEIINRRKYGFCDVFKIKQ